jgi:hypothetical protein
MDLLLWHILAVGLVAFTSFICGYAWGFRHGASEAAREERNSLP